MMAGTAVMNREAMLTAAMTRKALEVWPCPPKKEGRRRCNVLVEFDIQVQGTATLTLRKHCEKCGDWHETTKTFTGE